MLDEYLKKQFSLEQPWVKYTREDLSCLNEFIANLGIPLPQTGTFYQTRDRGALLLWSDLGLTLRITHQKYYPEHKHSHILQPLLERQTERMHIGLFPGLKLHTGGFDREKLKRFFYNKGIEASDIMPSNIGYLPDLKEDVPVLIDPDCIRSYTWSLIMIKDGYKRSNQAEIFRPLRDGFAQAWPDGGSPNPKKIKTVLRACAIAKTQGFLRSDWDQQPYIPRWDLKQNTATAAQGFAEFMRLAS